MNLDSTPWIGTLRRPFRSSSAVERSAVNRLVVGSSPTSGAIFAQGRSPRASGSQRASSRQSARPFASSRCFAGSCGVFDDRRARDRVRCSEHELARERLRDGRRSALRGREPGTALRVGFNSGVALSFTARRFPTGDPLLHRTHVVDVARVLVFARGAQSNGAKWPVAAMSLRPTETALG